MRNYVFCVAEIHAYRAEHNAAHPQYTAAQKNIKVTTRKNNRKHTRKITGRLFRLVSGSLGQIAEGRVYPANKMAELGVYGILFRARRLGEPPEPHADTPHHVFVKRKHVKVCVQKREYLAGNVVPVSRRRHVRHDGKQPHQVADHTRRQNALVVVTVSG